MKKVFTLIAAALMAATVNAQDWVLPTGVSNGVIPVGTTLLDNDFATITTANNDGPVVVLQDEGGNAITEKVGDYTFQYGVKVRVDAAPSKDNPTGTPHADDEGNPNIAIVVAAKQNTDVVFYIKVGSTKSFDGYDQTTGKAIGGNQVADNPDASWLQAAITFQLKGGDTYTFYTRGGTTTLYGIDTKEGTYSSESADGIYRVNFNGADNETPEGFFTYEGNHNFNTKFTGTYDGIAYTKGLKMEGSTVIKFTTKGAAEVLIIQSTWSEATIKVDDVELPLETATTPEDSEGVRAYTTTVAAGEHQISRTAAESGLFYIAVDTNANTTGIQEVVKATSNGAVYNLAGQQVDDQYKGVVIKNGQKLIQK